MLILIAPESSSHIHLPGPRAEDNALPLTLDLRERMQLVAQALMGRLDPALHYGMNGRRTGIICLWYETRIEQAQGSVSLKQNQ